MPGAAGRVATGTTGGGSMTQQDAAPRAVRAGTTGRPGRRVPDPR
jgi:hypothetical protein